MMKRLSSVTLVSTAGKHTVQLTVRVLVQVWTAVLQTVSRLTAQPDTEGEGSGDVLLVLVLPTHHKNCHLNENWLSNFKGIQHGIV